MQLCISCALLPSPLHLNHQRKHFTVSIYGCRIILAICCMIGKRLPCEMCLNKNNFKLYLVLQYQKMHFSWSPFLPEKCYFSKS